MILHVLAVAIPIIGLTALLSGYFFGKSDNDKTKFSELKMDNIPPPPAFPVFPEDRIEKGVNSENL